jgi:hypothetical protein
LNSISYMRAPPRDREQSVKVELCAPHHDDGMRASEYKAK